MDLKLATETIAVLPFRDITAANADSWGIGITDAIISRLTSLQNLAVRPTTSVLKYAKEAPDPVEGGQSPGRAERAGGNVPTFFGNVIRVTVQLIDGHTGTTKWSQRYDLKSADILTFEDEMATKVVEGLQIQISPTEQKAIQQPVTTNVDAYNDYLQARFYLNEYFVYSGVDSLEKGERLLLHAVSLDQDFADAYALLAQMYSLQSANFFVEAGANVKRGGRQQRMRCASILSPLRGWSPWEGFIARRAANRRRFVSRDRRWLWLQTTRLPGRCWDIRITTPV